jgi:carboxyl-terminal processing protease
MMRNILGGLLVFVVAVLAMTAAYGAGFYTAKRLPIEWLSRAGSTTSAPAAPAGAVDVTAAGSGADPTSFNVFWEALSRVQSDYDGKAPKPEDLTFGALRGSLKALDDPFTLFSDPRDTEVQKVELAGQFEGIGAYVNENEAGQLVIQTPMRGQPADKAGILAGDIILKVDGRDISGMNVNDAVLLIRGPKGTTVTLTVKREGEPKLLDIPVVRDQIEIPSVAEDRVLTKEGAPDVGYVQITVFAEETKRELDAAIDRLRKAGAKSIILDLRNNPGGYLDTAIEVASEFIPDGTIVMQEDNTGNRRSEQARGDGHALDMPLAVLINKGSASASEIVAGAIRDRKRGVLVGEKSYGKGSVQNVHELSDKSQLRVTVAAWLTPNGTTIHKKGITPDVEVTRTADDAKNQRDPQLQRAIQEVQKAMGKQQ